MIDYSRFLLSRNVTFTEFMVYNDPRTYLEISGMLFLTKCGSLAMMLKDPRAVVSLSNWWCFAWHEKSSALTVFAPAWLGCLAGHQSLTFGRTGCDVGIQHPWRRLHLRGPSSRDELFWVIYLEMFEVWLLPIILAGDSLDLWQVLLWRILSGRKMMREPGTMFRGRHQLRRLLSRWACLRLWKLEGVEEGEALHVMMSHLDLDYVQRRRRLWPTTHQ